MAQRNAVFNDDLCDFSTHIIVHPDRRSITSCRLALHNQIRDLAAAADGQNGIGAFLTDRKAHTSILSERHFCANGPAIGTDPVRVQIPGVCDHGRLRRGQRGIHIVGAVGRVDLAAICFRIFADKRRSPRKIRSCCRLRCSQFFLAAFIIIRLDRAGDYSKVFLRVSVQEGYLDLVLAHRAGLVVLRSVNRSGICRRDAERSSLTRCGLRRGLHSLSDSAQRIL